MPANNNSSGIGRTIKCLREAKGLTASKLALIANITTSQLCMVEKGLREPNVPFLTSVSEALSIPFEVLFALSSPDRNKIKFHNNKSAKMLTALDKLQDAEQMLQREMDKINR